MPQLESAIAGNIYSRGNGYASLTWQQPKNTPGAVSRSHQTYGVFLEITVGGKSTVFLKGTLQKAKEKERRRTPGCKAAIHSTAVVVTSQCRSARGNEPMSYFIVGDKLSPVVTGLGRPAWQQRDGPSVAK